MNYTLDVEGDCDEVLGVVSCEGKEITRIRRNHGSFPVGWALGHPNGHDYLIAGSDYQGLTVVELDTGMVSDFRPRSASKGYAFCAVDFNVSPSKTLLFVAGCYWACPWEGWLLDFSEPMGVPLPILRRHGPEDFVRWEEDTAILKDDRGTEIPWERPSYLDAAIHYLGTSTIREPILPCALADDVEMMEVLLSRVPPQEREEWCRIVQWDKIREAHGKMPVRLWDRAKT